MADLKLWRETLAFSIRDGATLTGEECAELLELLADVERDELRVPKEPSPGRLISMAIREDHALGCAGYFDQPGLQWTGVTHRQRLEGAMRTMRQLYEEATGQGFYSPEREAEYAALLESSNNSTRED